MIGEHGDQLGVMSVQDGIKNAEAAGLDLVEIAPTSKKALQFLKQSAVRCDWLLTH